MLTSSVQLHCVLYFVKKEFWSSTSVSTDTNIQQLSQMHWNFSIFGSSYICEQAFSVMNINKFNRWQFACRYACCLLPLVSKHWTTGFRQEMQYFSLSECTTCSVVAMKNLRSTNYFSLLQYIIAWCDCFLITSRGCHNSHFHSNACLC